MNDGTNIASDDIILKPKFRYWLMKNFLLITLWKSHSTLPLLATQNYPFWLKYD